MKNTIWTILAVLLVCGNVAWAYDYGYDPAKVQAGGHYMELAQDPIAVTGGYEYVIDLYVVNSGVSGTSYEIWGFDPAKVLNLVDGAPWYGGGDDVVMQSWDGYGVNAGGEVDFLTPSINDGSGNWQMTGYDWSMINTWHAPGDYLTWAGSYVGMAFHTASMVPAGAPYGGGTAPDDCLPINNYWHSTGASGLLHTVRVVYEDMLSTGDITWSPWWVVDPNTTISPVLGQWYPEFPVGDFNHDGHVDDADIDMLCNFIRLGLPYDPEYDISADGTSEGSDNAVDVLDLDYHVRSLVETSLGTGTEYGDFNLDGMIDVTDLTRLATNYGDDNWKWDDGNANRYIDTNIDNTDLTILATYYGFGVPDMVPEPMTLFVMGCGTIGLLRRRRRA